MDLLIFALILILIVGLVVYLIDTLQIDKRFAVAAKVLVLIIAILLLCDRAGLI